MLAAIEVVNCTLLVSYSGNIGHLAPTIALYVIEYPLNTHRDKKQWLNNAMLTP